MTPIITVAIFFIAIISDAVLAKPIVEIKDTTFRLTAIVVVLAINLVVFINFGMNAPDLLNKYASCLYNLKSPGCLAGQSLPQVTPETPKSPPIQFVRGDLYRTAETAVVILREALLDHSYQEIVSAARTGNPEAIYLVGVAKAYGMGVSHDPSAARDLFRRAALLGFRRAQVAYALSLEFGRGGPKNHEEAMRWVRLAAQANFPPALSAIGEFLFLSGSNGSGGADEAKHYFERAAAMGDTVAESQLAMMQFRGISVAPDTQKASAALEKLAEVPSTYALRELAVAYRLGYFYKPDPVHARALLERASELGNEVATFDLAEMQLSGEGGDADVGAAKMHLMFLVDDNYLPAISALAILLGYEDSDEAHEKSVSLAQEAEQQGSLLGLANVVARMSLGDGEWKADLERAATLARPALRRAIAEPQSPDGHWEPYLRTLARSIERYIDSKWIRSEADNNERKELAALYGEPDGPVLAFRAKLVCSGISVDLDLEAWDAPSSRNPVVDEIDWYSKNQGCVDPYHIRAMAQRVREGSQQTGLAYSAFFSEIIQKVLANKGADYVISGVRMLKS